MLKAALGIVFFPFLSVVAFLHGIYWFIKNVLKNSWAVVGISLVGPSILRKYEDPANKGENSAIAIFTCAGVCTILGTLIFTASVITIAKGRFEEMDWLWKVAGLLGCTNVLSAFYEGGRAYWNWLKKDKKKSEQEALAPVETTTTKPEMKQDEDDDDPIDNFSRLLNQIEALKNSDSFEETIRALLEEIEKLIKTDGLTFKQARHLADLIDDAKAEKTGLTKV